ncbi:chalcone-flavanone isomerase-domain-containing protein [Massariosphaeria phaeospora]|uniref:Chalcone-flavanone isomerase-domain-containing protein n=1 Tax=Massariosphaeria phaeospora TaxID=100035 RepID=A0A7C8HYQ3_9PLEO|nr:chalcone-flavanone isomerase-domain-containing protein [Massariosphaeria phaeospora]
MSARIASRPAALRCLKSPVPLRPQLRHLSRQVPRSDAEAFIHKGTKRPLRDVDNVSLHRTQAMRLAAQKRRRNWLAFGAALSMIAPILLVRLWDLPPPAQEENQDEATEDQGSRGILDLISPRPTKTDSPRAVADQYQGKKVVVAAGDKIIAAPLSAENPTASDADAVELVETGSSYVPYFPRTISLPTPSTGPESVASETEYTLLGLGIRKVSFLRVQVYVVGLYVRTASLSTLQNHLINTVNPTASALIPGEKDSLRDSLLHPVDSDKIWGDILSKKGPEGVDLALRVVPCRGTDFKHLQDGWMRGIASRTNEVLRRQNDLVRQEAADRNQIRLPQPVEVSEFSDESFGLAMKDFKGLFQGRGKAPKGSVILLTRNRDGTLDALYQPLIKTNKGEQLGELSRLGGVWDERVSRLVYLLYLSGVHPSSEEARKNIVEGCIGIVERPVGTVEGMVQ